MSYSIEACMDIFRTTARAHQWDTVMSKEDFQRMVRGLPLDGTKEEIIDAMEERLQPFKLKYELSIEDFSI